MDQNQAPAQADITAAELQAVQDQVDQEIARQGLPTEDQLLREIAAMNNQGHEMDDLEIEACHVLHDVLCQIRRLTSQPMNEAVRRRVNSLADAAHNIPLTLTGQASYRRMLESELASTEDVLKDARRSTF